MLAFQYDGNYDGLISFLETRLSTYLTPEDISDPPDGVPRAAYDHFPFHFSGKFPALGAAHLSDEGRSAMDESEDCPGIVDIGIRFYNPSLVKKSGRAAFKDGRVQAQRKTRQLFGAWRKKLNADHDLRSQCLGIELGPVEQGDHDRLGNPFWLPEVGGTTVLWVLTVTVRFYL